MCFNNVVTHKIYMLRDKHAYHAQHTHQLKLHTKVHTQESVQFKSNYCKTDTVNDKIFEEENFCIFHGFSVNSKNFPINLALLEHFHRKEAVTTL